LDAKFIATRQPARASSTAIPRPMPREAPVTKADFMSMIDIEP
jgi:hypothetical protein